MDLNRRQVIAAFGASTVAPLLPAMSQATATCTADKITRIRIIDASIDLTKRAQSIADAGISTVIRFYSRDARHLDNGKRYENTVLSTDELHALQDANLAIATVFQYFSGGSGRTFQNPTKKINDVYCARRSAELMKQPETTALYFGADFNLDGGSAQSRDKNIKAVKSYFEYAQREVAKDGRKIGVYGCGRTCEILQAEGWDMFYWLSASTGYWHTAEFFNTGDWHLFQTKTDIARPYGGVDTNILNPRYPFFGQWRKGDPAPSEPVETSQKIADMRRFVTPKHLTLFSDPLRPHDTIIPLTGKDLSWTSYARPVRVLCQAGDAVGISLNEDDDRRGFCMANDLSARMPTLDNKPHAPKGFGH